MFLMVNQEKTPSEMIVVLKGWELWNGAMESVRTKRSNLGLKVKPMYLYIKIRVSCV